MPPTENNKSPDGKQENRPCYATGKMVLELLQQINEDYKKTVVLITHNSQIAPMADKVIKIKNGRIDDVVLNTAKTAVRTLEW